MDFEIKDFRKSDTLQHVDIIKYRQESENRRCYISYNTRIEGSEAWESIENTMSSEDQEKTRKIEELLKLLKVHDGDMSKFTAQQRKDMKEYKFWKTQPVTKFDEVIKQEGPIDSSKRVEDIPDAPLKLLPEFEWCTVDVNDNKQLEDVYVLLNENYVEDKDSTFRFNYSQDFLNWALKPPGWKSEWQVGVRVKETKRLIGFISAIPTNLQVREKEVRSVEINFLCVHKKLRSKRLAPILIKEVTRRVNKHDIWQALHTGGVVLPSPVSVCRYAHRPLNWSKLYDVEFTALPANATKTQMIAKYTLPKTPLTNIKVMEEKHVEQAFALFNKYQERFELRPDFSLEEFKHWVLTREDVVYSYVIENEEGKVTDFVSFYSLPFTIINNPLYKDLGIGYMFYYASDADFGLDRFSKEGTEKLRKRLNALINDACILARNLKMDVFNALSSQDNALFLDDLKFGPGDGFLNFYLFNYRCFPITGGIREDQTFDMEKRSNVGVVML